MDKIRLVNIETIKDSTVLPANLNEKILTVALGEVTDLELEALVGTAFLEKLNKGVVDKNLTLEQKELINDYIVPYLIYGTLVYSIPYLQNKINNKGVNISTDATLTTLNSPNTGAFQNMVSMKWDSYKKRLVDYLTCNGEGLGCNMNFVTTTSSSSGVYIPDKTDNSMYYYRTEYAKYNWRR